MLNFSNQDLQQVFSPVKADVLDRLLSEANYDADKTKFLVDGFKEGFDIGYRGPMEVQLSAPNLKITVGSKLELWNKVMKEVEAKRYAGPFEKIPFDHYIQSPIGLVPKDNGKSTRLIFHLSYPRQPKGSTPKSVNANTPKESTKVKYPDFSEAVRLCLKAGLGCAAGKSDMKSAFRHFGIRKDQWKFLIMKAQSPFDNKFYYFVDKCLPFGAAISCKIFQAFSDAISFLVRKGTNQDNVNYLDDFFFVALWKLYCDDQIKYFLHICQLINFPVSMEKTFWGSTEIVFLGLLIDTLQQRVYLPIEKITTAKELLEELSAKKKTTLKDWQRLCGLLNFFTRCIVPGRAFTRRLYSLTAGLTKPHHHKHINKETRMDLAMWSEFLTYPEIYARPFADFSITWLPEEIDMFSDSSRNAKLGCGGICQNSWFFTQWNYKFIAKNDPSIAYLELYAVTCAVLLWIDRYPNRKVALFCDNMSVVNMINSSSSSCKNCMVLIRMIVLKGMVHNVRITAKHIPGERNILSDHLSRLRIEQFKLIGGDKYDPKPSPLPAAIWPMNKIWLN